MRGSLFGVVAVILLVPALLVSPARADGLSDAKAGLEAFNRGDNDGAVRLFTKALASGELTRSDQELAYFYRAQAHAAENDRASALADLDQAQKLDPGDQEAIDLRQKLESQAAPAPTAGEGREERKPSRFPTSFQWYYNFEPKGWRYWTQTSPSNWVESYDNGQKSAFDVVGYEIVGDCNGLLLRKEDRTIQAFVPDDRCANQTALFRLEGPGGPASGWHTLGNMERIQY